MMENKKMPYIMGYGTILSKLSLEEIAGKISEEIFGGIAFGGRDEEIYEETPAVYIGPSILGFLIVLSSVDDDQYLLEIKPDRPLSMYLSDNRIPNENLNVDIYLYHLLKQKLRNIPEIEVIETKYGI